MFFKRKKSAASFSQKSLRRRFHHFRLTLRQSDLPTTLKRPKRIFRTSHAPVFIIVKKIVVFAGGLGVFIGIIYAVFFSTLFTINKITIEKNGDALKTAALTPTIDKLRGENILFVNTDELTQELQQLFKNQILLVRIKKSYPHRIIVKVEEYPPVLNLRVVSPEKMQRFVLNSLGFPIFENTEQKELPIVSVHMEKPVAAKGILIAREKLTPMIDAFSRFTDLFGIKIKEGEWKKVERELHLLTEKNFTVWLDITADIETQLLKLKRALPKLDIVHEPLDYIDLRIAGKETERVIFKRRR